MPSSRYTVSMTNSPGRGNAAKPVKIDLDFDDAVKALLSVDPDDLPDKATSPSQPDRSQSDSGS